MADTMEAMQQPELRMGVHKSGAGWSALEPRYYDAESSATTRKRYGPIFVATVELTTTCPTMACPSDDKRVFVVRQKSMRKHSDDGNAPPVLEDLLTSFSRIYNG
jgi:hypothetical protein